MQLPPRLPSARLRRLSTVARVDALSVMLVAGLSLPLALWHGGPVISTLVAGAIAAGAVEWHGYAAEHTVCLEELRDIEAWLHQVLTDTR